MLRTDIRTILGALMTLATAAPGAHATGVVEPISPTKALADGQRGGPVGFPTIAGPVEPANDKTLAPYLFVAGGDPKTDRLPLKETSADVSIAGVIARVKVR